MTTSALKQQVLDVCKKLPQTGLVTGTAGNVSARDPETGLIAIKPSGYSYSDMKIDDIVVLHSDGELEENIHNLKPSFETPTHLEIYRRFPDILGIVHTHSKYAIILSCVRSEIPCLTMPTARRLLLQAVPVIDFINNGTQDMADAVAPNFSDHVAVVIQNHGPFTVGDSVQQAFERAVTLEDTSQIYFQASLLGPPSLIPAS